MFSACKYLYCRSRFCKLLVHPGNGREGKGEQGKGKERKVRAGEGRERDERVGKEREGKEDNIRYLTQTFFS